MSLDLDLLLDALADRVASRITLALDAQRAAPKRVLLADVKAQGAPSRAWVERKARDSRITIYGPRGGRFVFAEDLAAILAGASIKRAPFPSDSQPTDGRAFTLQLAAKRAKKAAA